MTVDASSQRTIIFTQPKNSDIEYRVSLLDVEDEGLVLLDFREYVKSSDFYGRGITMPLDEEKARVLASRILGSVQ